MKFLSRSRFAALAFAACGALASLLHAADEPFKLNLAFNGNGSVAANQSHVENRYNFKTKKYESSFVTDSGRKSFYGSGYIEIVGGNARVKLPSPMVPLLSGGGNGGWFTVSDLWVNDDEITGVIRLNALNKPKFRIDRRSGQISITGGFSDFTGQCDAVRADGPQRKF
jgi:hypothetical protein